LIASSAPLAPAQDLGLPINPIWGVPDVGALPDDAQGRLVRRGRDLITATYAHIGPEVFDAAKRYAGNNLACRNCHLEAGTKRLGLPLWGLTDLYPRYSPQTGGQITIEQRVNTCMERSMNGRAMASDAPEMQAIVAYIDFLSTGVPAGEKLPGLGAGRMAELTMPGLVPCATRRMAKESAGGSPPWSSAIWFRLSGERTASTTARG